MKFKKGQTPWNRMEDVFITCETCLKTLKVAHNRKAKARFCSHPCYAEWRKTINLSEEHKRKISIGGMGKHKESPSLEARKKMSMAKTGISINEWKEFSKKGRQRAMQQKDYVLWRTAVFMRDDYTCQECKTRGVPLQADHIKPWALYPELRYAIDNGRTLCVDCHRQTDTWGYKPMYRASLSHEGGALPFLK